MNGSAKKRRLPLLTSLLFLCLCLHVASASASTVYLEEACYPTQVTSSCYYDSISTETHTACADAYTTHQYYCPAQSWQEADNVYLTKPAGDHFIKSVNLTVSATGSNTNYYHFILYYNSGSGTEEYDLGWRTSPHTFNWWPPAGNYGVAATASANDV